MNASRTPTTTSSTSSPDSSLPASNKPSGYAFLDSLVPSYLAVDVEGRVLRLETFSKTIAPGCRLGYIIAQPALIERILRITETSTQQPSGFVQAMVAELLMGPQTPNDPGRGGAADGSGWGFGGWVRWLEGLRGNYERRMNTMAKILHDGRHQVKSGRRKSLAGSGDESEDEWAVVEKTQIYDFAWPMGGMSVFPCPSSHVNTNIIQVPMAEVRLLHAPARPQDLARLALPRPLGAVDAQALPRPRIPWHHLLPKQGDCRGQGVCVFQAVLCCL